MKILATLHRSANLDLAGRIIRRTAVRAVILRGRDLLMVYSANVGDYKFPGGGVNECESHDQALARELLEECGASLLGVDEELGAIIEYDRDTKTGYDVFMMTSHYYFCRVGNGFGLQNLEDYEKDLGFQPVWIGIDAAISANRSLLSTRTSPEWLRREIFALEYLKQAI